MKKIVIFLLALLPVLAAAQHTYTVKSPTFHKLKVVGPLNVDFRHSPDSVGHIFINVADTTKISWVEVSNSGSQLNLRLVPSDNVRQGVEPLPSNLPKVTVLGGFLTDVRNEGDSTVRILSPIDVPEFKAKLIGNGCLEISDVKADKVNAQLLTGRGVIVIDGKCDNASLSVTGVGAIDASQLHCKQAKTSLTGTGDITVNASERITVTGSGSGNVRYVGTPTIKKRLVLGLHVIQLDN